MCGADDNSAGRPTALEIVVSGRVQGVGYRFFCQRKALEFGVGGWVRNCPDGTVQVMAVGSGEAVKSLVAELRRGPRFGKVEQVTVSDVSEREATRYEYGEYSEFNVR